MNDYEITALALVASIALIGALHLVRFKIERRRDSSTIERMVEGYQHPNPTLLDHLPFEERLRAAPDEQRRHRHSTCGRCNLPWAVVSPRSVMYSDHMGVFALCTSCWDELGSVEDRMPYYVALVRRWHEPSVEIAVRAGVYAASEEVK